MHLSSGFLKICLAHGIRPFYLPPYTTKALMPLDQVAHAPMSREWAMLKQLLAQRKQGLTLYVALKGIAGVVGEGLKPSNAAASWAQCGFRPNQCLDRDKLFVERREELLKSLHNKGCRVWGFCGLWVFMFAWGFGAVDFKGPWVLGDSFRALRLKGLKGFRV